MLSAPSPVTSCKRCRLEELQRRLEVVEEAAAQERDSGVQLAARLGRAEGELRSKALALATAEQEGTTLRQQLQVALWAKDGTLTSNLIEKMKMKAKQSFCHISHLPFPLSLPFPFPLHLGPEPGPC